eukprot:1659630-Pyramimonas_sp.AAC.1
MRRLWRTYWTRAQMSTQPTTTVSVCPSRRGRVNARRSERYYCGAGCLQREGGRDGFRLTKS